MFLSSSFCVYVCLSVCQLRVINITICVCLTVSICVRVPVFLCLSLCLSDCWTFQVSNQSNAFLTLDVQDLSSCHLSLGCSFSIWCKRNSTDGKDKPLFTREGQATIYVIPSCVDHTRRRQRFNCFKC